MLCVCTLVVSNPSQSFFFALINDGSYPHPHRHGIMRALQWKTTHALAKQQNRSETKRRNVITPHPPKWICVFSFDSPPLSPQKGENNTPKSDTPNHAALPKGHGTLLEKRRKRTTPLGLFFHMAIYGVDPKNKLRALPEFPVALGTSLAGGGVSRAKVKRVASKPRRQQQTKRVPAKSQRHQSKTTGVVFVIGFFQLGRQGCAQFKRPLFHRFTRCERQFQGVRSANRGKISGRAKFGWASTPPALRKICKRPAAKTFHLAACIFVSSTGRIVLYSASAIANVTQALG